VKLIWVSDLLEANLAIELEKQIKGWSRKKKEALINGEWDKLKENSKCNNYSSHKYFKFKK